METLIVLGTGNAGALRCYNTCFVLHDEHSPVLVDAGGGNGILTQLARADVPVESLHHAFLTHCHTDHLLGMIWVLRAIATRMASETYDGVFTLFGHKEAMQTVRAIAMMTLPQSMTRFFDQRIRLKAVQDGEEAPLGPYSATFFDIGSTKARQFGFALTLQNGKALTCLGDEPCTPQGRPFAEGSDWLLSEAFCLYAERERFKPYEKHHGTVREACLTATELGVRNLVLWHTEDTRLCERKALYTAEGRPLFSGALFVPDDLDTIAL